MTEETTQEHTQEQKKEVFAPKILDSGARGWTGFLQNQYQNFQEFEAYSDTYGIAARLNFPSARAAWQANPMIEGSTNPADLKIVKSTQQQAQEDAEETLKEALKYARQIYRQKREEDPHSNPSHAASQAIEEAGRKFEIGHGAEGISARDSFTDGLTYLNQGDPYEKTIIFEHDATQGRFFIGDWGSVIENAEDDKYGFKQDESE